MRETVVPGAWERTAEAYVREMQQRMRRGAAFLVDACDLDDLRVVVDVCDPTQMPEYAARPWPVRLDDPRTLPLAFGRAALTFDPGRFDALARTGYAPLTPYTPPVSRIERDLVDVPRRGFAIDQEYAMLGYGCVAVPVETTRWRAVLGAVVPYDELRPHALAGTLGRAAEDLSRMAASTGGQP